MKLFQAISKINNLLKCHADCPDSYRDRSILFFEYSNPSTPLRVTEKIFLRWLVRFSFLLFLLSVFGCGTEQQAASSSHKTVEEKYSHLLGVNKENISDRKLYSFIDEWYGTPYRYGGKTKKGIDCSGFTSILYKEVFGKEIIGPSTSIYNQCKHISKEELKEGDLVFFKIDSKEISHVGIYLQNNKFVHATTKAGIMIDDLGEEYYKKYFAGGGKIK